MTSSDMYPPQLAVGVTSSRIAHVSAAAQALHRQILGGFAMTGHAPDRAGLTTPHDGDVDALLRELHDHDVIRLGPSGDIRAAYPFSGTPTVHRVAIDDGPTLYAMCAIDALGMSAMLGRDTAITTTDPTSGGDITVTIHNGHAMWTPETVVAVVGSDTTLAAEDCCTPSGVAPAADRCCGAMNLFTGTDNAQTWLAANPHISGAVLTKEQALTLGVDIFAHLLD